MTVLLTIASVSHAFGGPSRSVPALAKWLRQQGVRVELLTAEQELKHSHRWLRYLALARQSQLRAALRARIPSASVVHDNGVWLPNNHAVALVCRDGTIPRVVSPRGMLSQWALGRGAWRKRVAWTIYQRSDVESASLLHATSADEAEDLRRLGLRNPIAVIPNGIELPPRAGAQRSTRDGRRTILFLSRIHPKKGLLDLVHAWAKLRHSSSDLCPVTCDFWQNWRILIAGPSEDNHQAEVEALAARLGVLDDFEFVGPVSDDQKWNVYSHADLFVLPSYSENFGIVVGEALAAGVPVITTRATPWQELEAHRCGWWINTGADALTEALRQAFSLSDVERAGMGARGHQLIEQRYSWASAAKQMIEAYEWVLYRGSKPDFVHT